MVMPATPPIALRFLGFGEAASLFAKGLSGAGLAGLAAYDVAVQGGPAEALLRERAQASGTALLAGREGLADAAWVFAMVQPSVTEIAAREAAPHLAPGAFYVDFSSASPARKQAAAEAIAAVGAHYVDAGIIGSVPASGHKVAVVASGVKADILRTTFAPLGMDISVVGDTIGAAAGIKLIRSILAKGLEALYVEALVVAQRTCVTDAVLDSFCAFLDARDARATAALLVQSHVVHAARRADEVAMSRDMVVEAGVAPLMTDAIVELMRRSAASGVAERVGRRQPQSLEQALAALEQQLPDLRTGADIPSDDRSHP
jgi:3-hydroxyisobutyrate dehydrogenase-like beta-hydroxyacid dehydrogenase